MELESKNKASRRLASLGFRWKDQKKKLKVHLSEMEVQPGLSKERVEERASLSVVVSALFSVCQSLWKRLKYRGSGHGYPLQKSTGLEDRRQE